MRALILAIAVTVLAVGCTEAPTAPSPVNTAAVLMEQDAKPAPTTEVWVRLFFLCNQMETRRPVGMPVDIWWSGGAYTSENPLVLTVGENGGVGFNFPKTAVTFYYRTHEWMGMCPEEGTVSVPKSAKAVWSHSITLSHVECGTGM